MTIDDEGLPMRTPRGPKALDLKAEWRSMQRRLVEHMKVG